MQLFPSVSIFLPFPNGSPQSPAISLPFPLTFLLPKHPHLSNSLPLLNRHRHSHSLVQARSPNRWPPWTPRRRLQLSISRSSLRLRPPYPLTLVRRKLNSTQLSAMWNRISSRCGSCFAGFSDETLELVLFAVHDLRKSLQDRGSDLMVRFGNAENVIQQLAMEVVSYFFQLVN